MVFKNFNNDEVFDSILFYQRGMHCTSLPYVALIPKNVMSYHINLSSSQFKNKCMEYVVVVCSNFE